jgi:antitoxin (DNA-binding transcriptional repressor) of toxin-antitoxin stability system
VKIATISQTKNQLSAMLDRVKHGETILIVDRDQPVARLEPVLGGNEADQEGRLARLERAGLARRGRGALSASVLKDPPPAPEGGVDVVAALISERGGGR